MLQSVDVSISQFNFQMQRFRPSLSDNTLLDEKPKFKVRSNSKSAEISKLSSDQTLHILRNLNMNRFLLPDGLSLEEKLKICYKQYLLLFEENQTLNKLFLEQIKKKNQLAQILLTQQKLRKSIGRKIKRKRRYAHQIKRYFNCPAEECEKCYGREGSLTLHVKLKHLDYFKSGAYEAYINRLIRERQGFETLQV